MTAEIRRALRLLLLALAVCGLAAAAEPKLELPDPPALSGWVERGTLDVDGLTRTFQLYVPSRLGRRPALVVALHGGGGDGDRLRAVSGYQLDLLADREGLLVAYPDGFQGGWNDCRTQTPYAARRRGVDDVAFLRELVGSLRTEYRIPAHEVFVLGFSNGGHLALRLAHEAPDLVRAVTAIAAGVPAPGASACAGHDRLPAVLLIAGTADPLSPFAGGPAETPAGEPLGEVLPMPVGAALLARRAGHHGGPTATTEAGGVRRTTWQSAFSPEVTLLTLAGGGHTIPQPVLELPAFAGPTRRDVNALEEAWRFFRRAAGPPVPATTLAAAW